MNDVESFEDVADEVADNIDGVLAVLGDVRDNGGGDPRLSAAIAALQRTRDILMPLVDSL